MKNVRHDFDDSLRPEYRRSDFGDMVEGKYAYTQLEFSDVVRLLVSCVAEDEGLNLVHYSAGNRLAGHNRGDWTYEIDNAQQITLRYWLNEFGSLEERLTNPPCVTMPQERSELQKLIQHHVRTLKARVDQLKS
jgi:hypothetical protein